MSFSYSERLLPSFWQVLASMLVIPAVWLVTLPILGEFAIVMAMAVWFAVIATMLARSKKIDIRDGRFAAGSAQIPLSLLGRTEIIAPEDIRAQLGPDLDARAYLCFKSGKKGLVKVFVSDKNDPTPYWLVSTNDPRSLVAALESRNSAI